MPDTFASQGLSPHSSFCLGTSSQSWWLGLGSCLQGKKGGISREARFIFEQILSTHSGSVAVLKKRAAINKVCGHPFICSGDTGVVSGTEFNVHKGQSLWEQGLVAPISLPLSGKLSSVRHQVHDGSRSVSHGHFIIMTL